MGLGIPYSRRNIFSIEISRAIQIVRSKCLKSTTHFFLRSLQFKKLLQRAPIELTEKVMELFLWKISIPHHFVSFHVFFFSFGIALYSNENLSFSIATGMFVNLSCRRMHHFILMFSDFIRRCTENVKLKWEEKKTKNNNCNDGIISVFYSVRQINMWWIKWRSDVIKPEE